MVVQTLASEGLHTQLYNTAKHIPSDILSPSISQSPSLHLSPALSLSSSLSIFEGTPQSFQMLTQWEAREELMSE